MALNDLRAHDQTYRQLLAEIEARPSHGYLFAGPKGVGKNLIAQSLAHGLFCERTAGAAFCCTPNRCPIRSQNPPNRPGKKTESPLRCDCCAGCVQVAARVHPDFNYLAKPPNRTDVLIEQIRELIFKLGSKPARALRRIAIIDDAETLNLSAQNALLKTLEEPPGDAIIFLIASGDRALLDTVRSRLRMVRFGPLSAGELASILVARGLANSSHADTIGRLARGSASRALALIGADEPPALELLRALKDARGIDFPRAHELAEGLFSKRDQAAESFELLARLLEDLLTHKILKSTIEAEAVEIRELMTGLAQAMSIDAILDGMNRALKAAAAIEGMANPRLQAEQWWLEIGEAMRNQA
jgi:DNA polymerase-3 subunit delta'